MHNLIWTSCSRCSMQKIYAECKYWSCDSSVMKGTGLSLSMSLTCRCVDQNHLVKPRSLRSAHRRVYHQETCYLYPQLQPGRWEQVGLLWSDLGYTCTSSVYVWQSCCKFFPFDMQKLAQKINARQLTRTLKKLTCTVTYEEKHLTSIDTLEIQLTRFTRQLEYCKLQLKYPGNITHNIRRTSYSYIVTFNFALAIFFVTGSWDGD